MSLPITKSSKGVVKTRGLGHKQVMVTLASSLAAVALALVLAGILLAVSGKNPFDAYSKMLEAGLQENKLLEMVQRATPLILAAVAVAIGFKMNLFNIGVEGQFLIGMFCAAVAGTYVHLPALLYVPLGGAVAGTHVHLPALLHVPFLLLVAMTGGAAWAGIAAVLKVKKGVNEVIATIMLNAIALSVIDWLFNARFRYETPGNLDVKTKPLPSTAWVPDLVENRLTSFIFIALIVVVLFWLVVYKSRFGFRLRASGANAVAARTAGISSNRMIITAMLMSGAVAGLAGLPSLLGNTHAYGPTRPDGYGFNGIAVALLGRNHPAGIVVAALLWGFLDSVAGPLQIAKIPQSIVLVIKAIILLTVVIVNEVVARRIAKRTADRTAAQLALPTVAA